MKDDETKIAVYYIATGKYKILFPDFLKSLNNFFPKWKKIVKLISDGLEEYDGYVKDNVTVELVSKINHYPWPIVALYKMWHIKENFDHTCKYSCYFNSNSVVYNHNEDVFDLNKLTVPYHSFNAKDQPYDPWDAIDLNENSCAYLKNNTYDYIQSGFFFGPSNLVYKMCVDVCDMLKYDMNRCIFAQWHDESYLNKWCVLNRELVDKKFIFTVWKRDIDLNRFIFLQEKNDFGIKKG